MPGEVPPGQPVRCLHVFSTFDAGGPQVRTATLTGSDPYGLTALLIVRGYEALRGGEARGAGALAPAEAFDARRLLARLAPLLVLADGA